MNKRYFSKHTTRNKTMEQNTKTVNDLVRISTRKSKRISSGLMRLGSKPKMVIPFPLRHVVLQNTTVERINSMLATVTNGNIPIDEIEEEPFLLPRQPATEAN